MVVFSRLSVVIQKNVNLSFKQAFALKVYCDRPCGDRLKNNTCQTK
jgi:hypothetical protein